MQRASAEGVEVTRTTSATADQWLNRAELLTTVAAAAAAAVATAAAASASATATSSTREKIVEILDPGVFKHI